MNKQTLVSLVKKEASKLKQKATKDEIKMLTFNDLDPQSRIQCIYGQLSGDCFSSRAHSLIKGCAERVYEKRSCASIHESELNGKAKLDSDGDRKGNWFSPIECFIHFPDNKTNGNNKRLIDYLKGETKRLTFVKF